MSCPVDYPLPLPSDFTPEVDLMLNIVKKPSFSEIEAKNIVAERYGINGTMEALPSERDQNFLLRSNSGEIFIIKITNSTEEYDFLEAQNLTWQHLHAKGIVCPQVVSSLQGNQIELAPANDGQHYLRLVTYIKGKPYGTVKRRSKDLYSNLGRYLGRLDKALSSFDHPALHRDFHWDIQNGPRIIELYRHLITDSSTREFLEIFLEDYQKNIVPILPSLRKSIIHNDANDYNVIVGSEIDIFSNYQNVRGIIDFGDMVYSFTIAELAVAIAYAVLCVSDPIHIASTIVQNYNAEYHLDEKDVFALFGMVRMRLMMSVCLSAIQSQHRPDDDYLNVSQQPIKEILPILARTNPHFAEASFRHACGLIPVPKAKRIVEYLKYEPTPITSIFGQEITPQNAVGIDLSVGSSLTHFVDPHTLDPLIDKDDLLKKRSLGKNIGVGAISQARLTRLKQPLATFWGNPNKQRTIHLGIDLFVDPETPVFSPLGGKVHALNFFGHQNAEDTVLILSHLTRDNDIFFTLYRHLMADSLKNLEVGQIIEPGTCIGTVGFPDITGTQVSYLSFQLIVDLLNLETKFPAVVPASEREIWEWFSPNPVQILQIPEDVFPPQHPSKTQTLKTRRHLIGKNLRLGYRNPLKIERGWMQYLFDETGRIFIDAYNNVPHVGHCHPKVIEAGRKQMGILNTNTRYLHDSINRYAEKLVSTLPYPLEICFFVNSGSEANELALRLARGYTHNKDMIVLQNSYHGNTTSLIDISPYKHSGPGGDGAPSWVHTVPVPDLYRDPFRFQDQDAASRYAKYLQDSIESLNHKGIGLAGFIAETCPSVVGQIFLPDGYLAMAYQYVRSGGGVCIADEVQTGFGRIGTHFYAFEAHNVIPDIVVLGKPIGNGHPIGAVITTREIAEAFDNGMEFFSTCGGNTVSCTIGSAVLDVVLEDGLQRHAFEVGRHLISGLKTYMDTFPIIGDVRGSGLFIGVELVRNHHTLEPATDAADFIANRMMEMGILLGTDGPFHNVIKIRPPMPFSKQDADILLDSFKQILYEDFTH